MSQFRFSAAITLESNTNAPITVRVQIVAGNAGLAASRAIKQALKANRGKHWSSLVCVLLDKERLETPKDEAA